jgi:uncharacterized membrane protein YesL
MALIACPECRNQVSDKAVSCPTCGVAIAPQTVELTSKKFKKRQLIFGILLVVGASLVFNGAASGQSSDSVTAKIVIGIGLFMSMVAAEGLVVASIQKWWHHE